MNTDSTLPPSAPCPSGSGSSFHTTSWSMVLQAATSNDEQAELALAQLCEVYWFPLYAFIRRQGFSAPESEDLAQSFFADLLDKDRLNAADQSRGKFRTFLLASLVNFIKNHRRNVDALKRGGGRKVLSLDFEDAESKYQHQPFHELTAERIFDRHWAIALLNQVFDHLKLQYDESGKSDLFAALQGHLLGQSTVPHQQIADELEMKVGAIKVAIHRLRERYGQQLRIQIAKTIDSPQEVDEELKYLFEALAQ